MTLTTKEEIDQVFEGGMDSLRKSWKEKENNPPECPDTWEFNNKVLTKLVGILKNNSLEELHEVYGNTKEE